LLSCQEELIGETDPSILQSNESEMLYSSTLKDQLASKVAKNIAASLVDPGVVDFLRTKASERIDGDFNFLIELNRNESIGTSSKDINKRTRTFGSIIAGADLISKRTANVEDLLDSIARIHPLLQVYMPEFSDEIDFSTDQDYLVAFVPSFLQNDIVPAYDKEGNYFGLDANTPPTRPVIVISENERIMAIPKNQNESSRISEECPFLAEAIFENEQNTYYMRQDVLESNNTCIINGGGGGGGGGGTIGSGPGSGCERDSRVGKERFYRFKLKNMNIFDQIKDQWINGNLEIDVSITIAPLNGAPFTVTKAFYLNNSDLRNCGVFNCETQWRYESAEIITWTRSLYGDRMMFVWSEFDPGNTQTQNFSFSNNYKLPDGNTTTSNVSFSITTTDATDKLGSSVVEYCDGIGSDGFMYDTGSLFFQAQ
jgi:hypothetical protein